MKMEQTDCSETTSHKIQTPGNNPEESIQQKIRTFFFFLLYNLYVTVFIFRYPMGTVTYNHLNIGSISVPDNLALVL